jgi:hypothetical protein
MAPAVVIAAQYTWWVMDTAITERVGTRSVAREAGFTAAAREEA